MISKKINNNTKLVLSFDDYHPLNIKIAEMLLKLNLPATFFIDTFYKESHDQIKKLFEMGFEIGGHTFQHPQDLRALPLEEAKSEIEIGKRQIENITGEECKSFAYTRGRFNDEVVGLVKAAGFDEARTTKILRTSFVKSYEMPATIHFYNGRKEYGGKGWRVWADFYLDTVRKNGGIFHMWGHSAEIDRDGDWENVESFLRENFAS